MKKDNQNILKRYHIAYSRIAAGFRERVCEDCNWSTPTFYRKMRSEPRSSGFADKCRNKLTVAEERRIKEIMNELNVELTSTMKRFR